MACELENPELFIVPPVIVALLTLLNASGWSAPEIVQLVSDEPFEFIVIPVR